MPAGFDDLAVLDHQDAVGMHDGVQAMRDRRWWCGPRQRCAIASCTSRSDSESSAAVASSSRMIGAFLISARAIAMRWRWPPDSCSAVFADRRVVAVRKRHDEVMRVGGLGRGDDLVLGRAGLAEGDVVADRAAEQKHVLPDIGDLLAQRVARHVGDVLAVDRDRAAFRSRRNAGSG